MSNELKKTAPISITRGAVPRLAQTRTPGTAPFSLVAAIRRRGSNNVPSATLTRTRNVIDAAGIQVVTLAKVFGIPQSSLSSMFADKMYIGAPREAELLTVASRCAKIVETLKPLELSRNGVQAAATLEFLLTKPLDELAAQVSAIFERGE